MICHVFKPRRRIDGKLVVGRLYRGRYKFAHDEGLSEVALNTSDKQVAEKRLRHIIEEKQREADGIVTPKPLRQAAQKALKDHMEDFLADLQAKGRDEMYVKNLRVRLVKLIEGCQWQFPKDVTADSFILWREEHSQLAAKTKNDYLDAGSGLLKWMLRSGRVVANPLQPVGKVSTSGKEAFHRRAFTKEEIKSLLEVSGDRNVVYLVAVNTGLRRAELAALQKGDCFLYGDNPFLKVRASTTKNARAATIWLNQETTAALRKLVTVSASPGETVFERIPDMDQFRRDLKQAGIPFVDEQGRRADFHALRHTLATNLSNAGVSPRLAMAILRHSEMRLTMKTYTDESQLPLAEAVEKLPQFFKTSSQLSSQQISTGSQSESLRVTTGVSAEVKETPVNVASCHALSLCVTSGQETEVVHPSGVEPETF